VSFRGLTWDHPRGFRALEAAAAGTGGLLQWSRQPLEGFESHPIADLAARYDLLVLDHPHVGEAVGQNCLQPIEDLFEAGEIAAWEGASIGAALRSYRWAGRHWALPLDVAMQVMARDPDTIPEAPDSWDEVITLSGRAPVALSLAGPHAILTFFSLCLSLGVEPGGDDLVGDAVGREALDRMQRLARRAPAKSVSMNPIALLEAIARRDGVALAPLVFGYVNYAVPNGERRRVGFSNAPRTSQAGRRGSVLGGTGIGITARARPNSELLGHLRWLMGADAQSGFIPGHDGQPSARDAWRNEAVNAAWSGFYADTAETAEDAWVRPRFDGYIAFQTEAASILRECLSDATPPQAAISRLRATWQRAREAAAITD
jgi:multiple sugar transport system substrate-binding protein